MGDVSAIINVDGLTLIRTRGLVSLYLETVSAINSGMSGAIGMAVVTTAAVAAGVASVPSPITEDSWDGWFWHQFFDVRAITATIADGANAGSVFARFVVDSKAMRKVAEDESLIYVIEVGAESGAATLRWFADSRLLVKLS